MAEFLIRARLATAAAGVLLVGSVAIGATPITVQAQAQVDVVGSSGSGSFGSDVLVLSNGNYVVADPQFDSGAVQDVGAVYLYNGTTNQVISTITGSQDSDFIGEGGLKEVGNSNFVILSPSWQNGVTVGAGAVTWVNGTTGLNGHVTAANSLVGTTAFDSVGVDGVTVLTNGNYVVDSSVWAGIDRGAVTWGNGNVGISGAVSPSNSLVGVLPLDAVGVDGVTALTNGNYVVGSGDWSNGNSKPNAGAVTWGDGTNGTTRCGRHGQQPGRQLARRHRRHHHARQRCHTVDQRQLRRRQFVLGQRRIRRCRRGHVGQRHRPDRYNRQPLEQHHRHHRQRQCRQRWRDRADEQQLRRCQPVVGRRGSRCRCGDVGRRRRRDQRDRRGGQQHRRVHSRRQRRQRRRDGLEGQRQLRGVQPVVGQRRGGRRRRSNAGQRHER